MKRLLALLLVLLTSSAYAQQLDWTNAVNVPNIVVNPSMDNCVSGAPTCGAWKESGSPLGNWVGANGNGGALDPDGKQYTFSYMPGTLYQDIDLSQYQTNLFNFTFLFDLNNSCRNFIGGACDRIDGPIDPFSVTLKFYDTNGLNNSFTFLSGNPSTATIGCVGDAEILGLCLLGQNVQDNWQTFGWYSHVQSNGLFTSARLEFTGNDAGFWGGLYGPSVDNALIQINYMPPPYPVSGGGAGMNVSAPGSDYIFIFKGNDPVLFSQLATKDQDLVGWTAVTDGGSSLTITSVQRPDPDYLFLYTDGIPVSGSWYSFQEIAPVTTVDCVLEPFNPQCIIDSVTPDEEPIMFADTGSDDGSSDGTEVIADEEDPAPIEEEMLAEADPIVEELVEDSPAEESLEELLAEESASEEDELDEEVTAVAAIKEMVNEEKASALSDNISKDVLGAALSVAADAVSAATVAGGESASSSTSSDSSSRSTTLTAAASETVATTTETVAVTESTSETVKEESAESSAVAALEILDTGRQLGQEALSVTLALTEASATESLSEAESIAAVSSSDSVLASMTSIETAAVVVAEEQQVASNETTTETVTEETIAVENAEVVVAENNIEGTESISVESVEQKEEIKEETLVAVDAQMQQATETAVEQREEVVVAETTSETVVENVEQVVAEVQSEQSSAVEFTTVDQAMEVFASNVNQQAATEQEELENNIVQQAIATSQQNDDENKMGFAEAEAVTIASDPALANAFNVQPNAANLELLGVLGSRAEEKSDAELRAEQVVAANKEQQDAINANYMEADQSGILAAIGSETDVSAYRSAMLRDASAWYKPEDIYKGVIIKDNVRGSYFLEKGNTDTYKKMVEEQYKDE